MQESILTKLKSFRRWFDGYDDNYIIIGGAACSLIFHEEEAEFRPTKDVDIVLIVEALDSTFGKQFWDFILDSGYKHYQKSIGKAQFYRFFDPTRDDRPKMIELFSRRIDSLILPEDARITPVPLGDDISSLSAILLNDEYYDFLRNGVRKISGLPVLDELYMIPFKAKAWLELNERRSVGGRVDSADIRKHKRDIYRLADIITDGFKFTLPLDIEDDMREFIKQAQIALVNTPAKDRKGEQRRIEKIVSLFDLHL
jgi:hypothetical protein